MGRTNLRSSLETKLAKILGKLGAAENEYDELRKALRRLIVLRGEIAQLRNVANAAEVVLKFEYPGWTRDQIKPTRAGVWKSPFRSGEQGKVALETLRESKQWMRPRDVAKAMLDKIEHDASDEDTLHRVTSSVGIYFKKYENELVESRGDYAKEWRVIGKNS